ncbi:MAG: NAD(P)H-dependent oxidoreductase [Myxococcota bacterium]
MALALKVIIGSTRPGRRGPIVARWVADVAREHGAFDVEVVDLAEIALPLLDEPAHPARKEYEHAHTKLWSAKADAADAFVFVNPEYDYFVPATVVNAVQALLQEWTYKVAGVVGYGGLSGGLRSAQELRGLLSNVGVMPLPATVALPFFWDHIAEDGTFDPGEKALGSLQGQLDELAKWAGALQPLHSGA